MIKNILFDFDGVILDSMPVREYGFRKIFEAYPSKLIEALLTYHNQNGGLSRYVKIRYFYEKLLHQPISENEVIILAEEFSKIMKKELVHKKYLISDSLEFIQNKYQKYNFHIVSGSDEKELQFLCKALEIEEYFISIHGSPTHKNILVKNIFLKNKYQKDETILIGDSINDYEASKVNDIHFYGYNNIKLKPLSYYYIDNFNTLYV